GVRDAEEAGVGGRLVDVDVVRRIGAAHVERGRRARGPDQAEVSEELLHRVQVRRVQARPGQLSYLDGRHRSSPQPAKVKRGSAAGISTSGSFSSRRTMLAPRLMGTLL